MTDKELADAIAALECAGGKCGPKHYIIAGEGWSATMPTESYVRDWRVAGALLNEVRGNSVESWFCICRDMMHLADAGPLARAINLACVEALHAVRAEQK